MAKKKNVEQPKHEMTHRQLSHHRRQQRRQRIIFISGIAIIVAVVVIVISGWVFSEYRPLHRTLFKVNNAGISMADFIDTIKIAGINNDAAKLQSMAGSIANEIISDELIRQGAEQLGITVSDEEVKTAMKGSSWPDNAAARSLVRTQLLTDKLKSDYFGAKVPASDNQVYIMAMLAESENIVPEIKAQLMSDNFTTLAQKYAQNYTSKKVNNGDYGWHPASILKDLLGSDIPINWAFSAQPGDISPALPDTEAYKQFGYWLLKVNEVPEEGSANVSAILVSSAYQANDLKTRLQNGSENLTAIADTYSQYSPSQETHGELGMVNSSENISEAFNKYVYDSKVPIGQWSDPIPDTQFYTKGGAWLVQLIGEEDNRPLSNDDKNTLINKDYNNWANALWQASSASIVNNLNEDNQKWAVDRAVKGLKKS